MGRGQRVAKQSCASLAAQCWARSSKPSSWWVGSSVCAEGLWGCWRARSAASLKTQISTLLWSKAARCSSIIFLHPLKVSDGMTIDAAARPCREEFKVLNNVSAPKLRCEGLIKSLPVTSCCPGSSQGCSQGWCRGGLWQGWQNLEQYGQLFS